MILCVLMVITHNTIHCGNTLSSLVHGNHNHLMQLIHNYQIVNSSCEQDATEVKDVLHNQLCNEFINALTQHQYGIAKLITAHCILNFNHKRQLPNNQHLPRSMQKEIFHHKPKTDEHALFFADLLNFMVRERGLRYPHIAITH